MTGTERRFRSAIERSFASLILRLRHAYVWFVARRFTVAGTQPIALLSDCPEHSRRFMPVRDDVVSRVRELSGNGWSVTLLFSDPKSHKLADILLREAQPNCTILLTRAVAARLSVASEGWRRVSTIPQLEAYTTAEKVQEFAVSPAHLFVFLSALWVIGFNADALFPRDDLLRHAVAYLWNYDYGVPYIRTTHSPPFAFYIGFDLLAGALHRAIGDWSLLVVQLVCLGLTVVALARFLKGTDPWLRILALTLCVVMTGPRIALGRPSLLCSAIMMVLFAYHGSMAVWARLLISSALAPLYYLFFVYHLPLLLLDRRYVFTLMSGAVFWLVYSQGTYFTEIGLLLTSLSGSRVAENFTIAGFLAGTWLLLLPLLIHWRKDRPAAMATLYFILLNQARYAESILPLMLSFIRHLDLKVRPVMGLGLVFLTLYNAPFTVQDVAREIPRAIPPGSRVLSESMTSAYHLVYYNPELRVAPSYNYGWTDPGVRSTIASLSAGGIECNDPVLSSFDYLVEHHMVGPPPPCLMLTHIEKGRRLWKIVR